MKITKFKNWQRKNWLRFKNLWPIVEICYLWYMGWSSFFLYFAKRKAIKFHKLTIKHRGGHGTRFWIIQKTRYTFLIWNNTSRKMWNKKVPKHMRINLLKLDKMSCWNTDMWKAKRRKAGKLNVKPLIITNKKKKENGKNK